MVDIVVSCRSLRKSASVGALLAIMAIGASGCAITGNALPDIAESDQLVTQSVVKKTKPEGIEATDAELIKTTVVAAGSAEDVTPLAWRNPQTGSSGAIVAIDNFMGKHGQQCRGFKTSVANFMGIAYYNGETCQISGEKWVLSWFKVTQ